MISIITRLVICVIMLMILSMGNIMAKEIMKVSDEGKALIEKFEGRRHDIYICPGGKISGGIGHALIPAETRLHRVGTHVDDSQIDKWFIDDIAKVEKTINNWVVVDLVQGQFDALASFVFNVGSDQFKRSTLLKLLNKGAYTKASEQFQLWTHAKGRVLSGLVARRSEEADMFRKGTEVAEAVVTS